MKKLLVVLFSLLFLYGCTTHDKMASDGHQDQSHHADAKVTKHFEGSHISLTDKGLYSVELVVPAKQLRMGVNAVEVIVHHGTGGDVPGATVSVKPWMPGMGHGVMEKPTVMERGGGLYSFENVVFSMTGHWQLVVSVDKDGKQDSVTFEFPAVMAMGHDHQMMPTKVPSDLDISTMKTSDNGHFHVSYESMRGMIMINKIHSWKVSVKSSNGQPVDGAHLTVVGDMPEHGHGLPTQPLVSKGSGPGEYLIEGMKFSMPGWWIVTFHLKAAMMQDSVSFNLKVQ